MKRIVRIASVCSTALILASCASSGVQREFLGLPDGAFTVASQVEAASSYVVEVIAVDRTGNLVDNMTTRDFEVVVDKSRSSFAALGKLYRGPGSQHFVDAWNPETARELEPFAEPARLLVLVVDQASLLPGDERRARMIADRCLASFGLGDRVTVIVLAGSESLESMSSDRSAIRQTLDRLRGQRSANPSNEVPPVRDPSTPERPDRTKEGGADEPERTSAGTSRPLSKPEGIPTLDSLRPEIPSDLHEEISPEASRAHATATINGLTEICVDLRGVPGSKTILFLSAGVIAEGAGIESDRLMAAAARSFVRVYSVQVPTPAPRFAEAGRSFLSTLAERTGGALITLANKPEQALQKLAGELTLSYLLALLPPSAAKASDPLPIEVTSLRKGVTIRAARLLAAGRYLSLLPGGMNPTMRRPARPRIDIADPTDKPVNLPRTDPEVTFVLARVSDYAAQYGREMSAVVAEEIYDQEWQTPKGLSLKRRLKSDYLMVRVPGVPGWLPFRDVYEVDGDTVRDRSDRLMKLFVETPPGRAVESARLTWEESARYNLGEFHRTVNIPVLPLMFLESDKLRGFSFRKVSEETFAGTRAVTINYQELGRPTIIKTSAGSDVPASGWFLVEPTSGRILRTLLRAGAAEITVSYGPRDELPGLWPPVLMEESYSYASGKVKATATYSKFRRFQVLTSEQIKIPK